MTFCVVICLIQAYTVLLKITKFSVPPPFLVSYVNSTAFVGIHIRALNVKI